MPIALAEWAFHFVGSQVLDVAVSARLPASDGDQKVTFSLGHSIDPKVWNAKREERSDQDEYYYTLMDFKRYLEERYNLLKSEKKTQILDILKTVNGYN